jgi:ABC-type branched-subunit amino acid transport system ATPase component
VPIETANGQAPQSILATPSALNRRPEATPSSGEQPPGRPEGAPLLEIIDLEFSYGPMQVLFGINFEVHRGEVVALLGANGAGKSTLLRALSGLGACKAGTVRFAGNDITRAQPRARVHLGIVQVPEARGIFPNMSVLDNLRAGAYSFVWERERFNDRIRHVIELFPVLGERLDQLAGTLSGGEQQMLALASGLLLDPTLLLIDELSLGLAPLVVQQLLRTVQQLKEQGITIIFVEQSVNQALRLADRAVFIEKGQVRFDGSAAHLLERDDLLHAAFLAGGD